MSLFWNSILPYSLPQQFIKLLAIGIWHYKAFNKAAAELLCSTLGQSSYYLFTSARGSLAFFFNSFLAPGDEVLLTGYTCLAVPTACIFADVIPIYIDVKSDLSLDFDSIKKSLTDRTRCIVVQHTLGGFALSDELIQFCKLNNLFLIEDCSLSMGSKFNNRAYGSFGDAAIYSFELSKIISCGWGGALRINNSKLFPVATACYQTVPIYSLLFSVKDFLQTFVCSFQSYYAPKNKFFAYFVSCLYRCGFFRLSTPFSELHGSCDQYFLSRMAAAQLMLLCYQLKRAPNIFQSCNSNFMRIASALSNKGFFVHAHNQPNVFVVTNRVLFFSYDKLRVVDFFRKQKVETGSWFDNPLSPIPTHNKYNYYESHLPNSHEISAMSVNLPCHSLISKSDLHHIIHSISKF